jgi:DNA mismatch repair protein MutS
VPDQVINKAKEHLKELEEMGAAPVPAARRSDDGQLTLSDVGTDEVKDILKSTDLNTLTPIEAMNLLYELQKKARA